MLSKTTEYQFDGQRKWHLIDAKTESLGRLASRIVLLLQGKNKAIFAPQLYCGDFVIVINTQFVKISHPAKWDKKVYHFYSGYPGGLTGKTLRELANQDPNEIIKKAIYNMLPKNKLRTLRFNRLKLFVDSQEGKELYASMKKKGQKSSESQTK